MHDHYNFSVNDVSAVYAGPGGKLWELLMGEEIHVGGAEQTDVLAKKAGIDKKSGAYLLDICSALGGPARHIAEKYDAKVVGLDITPEMIEEAKKRTAGTPAEEKIEYRLGSALDIPAHDATFDVVWGQDAWCYIRDKKRLIEETHRVLKTGGILAFTDWIWGITDISKEEADELMTFMVFPDLQTFDGYTNIVEKAGYKVINKEYKGEQFAGKMDEYVEILQSQKDAIIAGFGEDLYDQAEKGVLGWQSAAHDDKVAVGLWIAKKK